MRSGTRKYQRPTAWKVTLVGLVAVLALLLVVTAGAQGGVGAGVRGSAGAEGQRSRGAAVQPQTSEVLQTSEVSQPLTVIYTYDDAGRLVSVDYGDGMRITYTYDTAGNMLRREVAGGVVRVYLPVILKNYVP